MIITRSIKKKQPFTWHGLALAPQREALPRNFLQRRLPAFAVHQPRAKWNGEQQLMGLVLFQAIRYAIKYTGGGLSDHLHRVYSYDYEWIMSDHMVDPHGGVTFAWILQILEMEGFTQVIRNIVNRTDPRYKQFLGNKARLPFRVGNMGGYGCEGY